MVAWIRIRDGWIFAARFPIKVSAVYDNAAEGGPVAAEELGGGVNYDVRAVFDRTDQVWRAEGVVDDQRQAVLMSDCRDSVDIRNIAVRVAQCFQIDGAGVRLNRRFYFCQVVGVYEGSGDAVLRQRVGQQVVAAAVDGLLGYDVAAVCSQSLNDIGDGRRSRSQRQSRDAAFQGCQSLLQDVLGGVCQSSVDVACVRQSETSCRVSRISEYIGGRLINWNRSCVAGRIRCFLSYVKL